MSSDWLVLALAALSARWLWVLGATLLRDLDAASGASVHVTVPPEDSTLGRPTVVEAHSRVPLNRVLAFRGVARRVRARRRWEGGFGRRGL